MKKLSKKEWQRIIGEALVENWGFPSPREFQGFWVILDNFLTVCPKDTSDRLLYSMALEIVEKTKKLRKKKAVLAAEGLILKKLTLKSDKKRVKKVFLELRGAFEELTAKKK